MSLFSMSRWLGSMSSPSGRVSRSESRPPVARARWQGRPSKAEDLAEARLDFSEALIDVRSTAAASALDRIAIARSLHELWHLREEVFSLVACRHDQGEAARRLSALDRHFPRRTRRAGLSPVPSF